MKEQKDAEPGSLDFEASLEELEELVERISDDSIPLEELIVRYERGNKLIKRCGDLLGEAEDRIKLIQLKAEKEADESSALKDKNSLAQKPSSRNHSPAADPDPDDSIELF